jgi:threonine/homoserine/homoserine lactone efflux protein
VLGQGLKSGPRAGIAASFGIATGSLIHLALVAAGLAVVLAEHPQIFDAIRWAGAAYLVWIAVRTLATAPGALRIEGERRGFLRTWRDGILVNVLNPKTIVFMFAFLPPLVHPENGAPLLQLLILGTLFNAGGTIVNCLVAVFRWRNRGEAPRRATSPRFLPRNGALFLRLAARMALEPR